MTYLKTLFDKIEDRNKWPSFERPDFLNDLIALAKDSYNKKTTEGYLSAVLIYHQLTEEFVRVLIKSAEFYIQLRVIPYEYRTKDYKNKMFGQLIDALEQLITDDDLESFVEKAKELNILRIKIVHKLTSLENIAIISSECQQVQVLFNELFELFDEIYDRYIDSFSDYAKDIDEYKEEYLEE